MGEISTNSNMDRWTCPNDRQLALRAKLGTGWSVHTNKLASFQRTDHLSEDEQEHILSVIAKADYLEQVEQERIGRLVEKLENMKKNAMGNGNTQCILCGDEFGLLGANPTRCDDCKNAVCTKCGIDTYNWQKQQLWLCKICSENREVWKRSGAWFFKGIPKYVLPEKKSDHVKFTDHKGQGDMRGSLRGRPMPARPYQQTWSRGRGTGSYSESYEQESSDSSDDDMASMGKRRTTRPGDSESDNISITSSTSGQYYSGHVTKESRSSITSSNYHGGHISATESSRGDEFHDDSDSESATGYTSSYRHHSSSSNQNIRESSRYRYH